MLYRKYLITVFWSLALMFIASCSSQPSGGGGGGNGGGTFNGQISGTITVSDTNFWSKIKVGFFSNTVLNSRVSGLQPWPSTTNIYYNNSGDTNYKTFAPVALGIIGGNATNTSRPFTLSISMPDLNTFYLAGVWYDANDNNQWEVTNSFAATGSPSSELILLPQITLADFSGVVYTNSVVKYIYNGPLGGFLTDPFVLDAYNPVSNMNFVSFPIDNTIFSTFKFFVTATNY